MNAKRWIIVIGEHPVVAQQKSRRRFRRQMMVRKDHKGRGQIAPFKSKEVAA